MKAKYSKLNLDEFTIVRFEDILDRQLKEEAGEYEQKLMKLMPPIFDLSKGEVHLPYLGKLDPYTLLLCESLSWALDDGHHCWDENEDIYYRKIKRVKNFIDTGSFVISRKPKKPQSKIIDDSRNKLTMYIKTLIRSEFERLLLVAEERLEEFGSDYIRKEQVIEFSTAEGVHTSKGGRHNDAPYLKFALNRIITKSQKNAVVQFREYCSISDKSDIGSVTGSLEKYIAVLVAHELAHVIQYQVLYNLNSQEKWSGMTKIEIRKPHGEGWRFIYRILRKHGVNSMS